MDKMTVSTGDFCYIKEKETMELNLLQSVEMSGLRKM